MLGRLKFDIESLVAEMLDQIPAELWKSDSTTFLDPALGGGQFVGEIEHRLREYNHSEENIAKRVFGAEQSRMRLNFAVQKHKLVGKYAIGGVDLDYEEVFGLKKFDVIVGNPPFQNSDLPQNNSLWPLFINKSFFQLLREDGYMAVITPTSWMNPSGEVVKRKKEYNPGLVKKNIFEKYKTLIINIDNIGQYFNVGSTFSYYIVQKTKQDSSETTRIKVPGGEINVNFAEEKFIPLQLSINTLSIVKKFFNKPSIGVTNMRGEGFHSSHSKRVSKEKKTGFNFPLADTSAKYKNGQWLWASEKHPYQDIKKVIISESGYLGPMYDNGTLGTTEHSFIIPVSTQKEGERIVELLDSKLYKFVMKVCRWGSANHKYVIANLPGCTSGNVYDYFGLTQDEIDLVENSIE